MKLATEIEHLKNQTEFYDEIINEISVSTNGYNELKSVIGPILTLNSSSLKSIILLAENNLYRDLIILSRPFLECIINVGFICAESETAILNSKKHAYQKGYRDLFREIDINGFKINSGFSDFKDEFDKAAPKGMKEALSEFTNKRGKEISGWTSETTKAKLEVIGKKYGDYVNVLLTFAFFSIYRDVSEIIHNSYYGVRIFTGMQLKNISDFKDSDDAAKFFVEHQEKLTTFILQQLNISINSLLNIINQKFELESTKAIFEKSNERLVNYAENQK